MSYDIFILGFPSHSAVKNRPAMQEMQIRSLGQEDPLEKEMAAHSSILVWEIPWIEEPDRLQCINVAKSWTQLKQHSM